MRTDLGMRKGKMIAQGAHASMACLLNWAAWPAHDRVSIVLSEAAQDWLKGAFTKICVRVNSEEELLQIHKKADDAGLLCSLIQDSGRTEFKGVPTYTCCAIGPDYSEKIDEITRGLALL